METFEEHSAAMAELGHLQAILVGGETLQEFLDSLAMLTARATSRSCGIIVRARSGNSFTVAGSDTGSIQIGDQQITQGEGPALDAIRDGVVVAVADLSTDQRWHGYGAYASRLGARSSMSCPIQRDGTTFGALSLYSFGSAVQLELQQAEAVGIASREARTIELAMQMAEQAELVGNLQTALTSRSTIDQAIGVVMAEQRCDSRAAFELLRSASQHRNVKLRDVADGIVSRFERRKPVTIEES